MSETTEHELAFGQPAPPVEPVEAPVPRIAQLLALAIRFEKMLQSGKVESMADIARAYGISHGSVSQTFDLLNLTPLVQHHILLGRISVAGQRLRSLTIDMVWCNHLISFSRTTESVTMNAQGKGRRKRSHI